MVGNFDLVGLCTMGGTIQSDEDAGGIAIPDAEIDWLEYINKYVRLADSRVHAVPVCCLDSRDITDAHREILFQEVVKSPLSKFLLLHGTFTIAETLNYLEQRKEMLGNKTIVSTASFWTAAGRSSLKSDAAFNVGGAYYVARFLCRPGIYFTMHGALWTPAEVEKDIEHNLFVRKI